MNRTTDNGAFSPERSRRASIHAIVAFLLVCAIFVACFSGCSGCSQTTPAPGTAATGDEAASTGPVIDENAYVFSDGIYIDSISLGGQTYAKARELALAECDSMIHDFTLTVKADDKSFDYTKTSFTWDNNIEDILKEAAEFNDALEENSTEEKTFNITFEANKESVETVVSEIAAEVDVEAQNSTISTASGSKVSFTQEKVGYELDQEALVTAMTESLLSLAKGEKETDELVATINEVQPDVVSSDLSGNIKLLSTFSTTTYSTENAKHNMKTAMNLCNGSVIEPGETWSFSGCAGNTNSTENGYRAATVISNGEYTQGIGGGVCQACTTIYGAALRANLTIVERYNHRYPSSYVPIGQDATIAYPILDLKLRNDTDYPIYLNSSMSGGTLTATFYGWQDPSFDTIKISSWQTYSNDSTYGASAVRIFYKNGAEVRRENLPSSTYSYPSSKTDETTTPSTAATKPAATKPAATKPAATKPAAKPTTPAVTDPPTPVVPVVTDPPAPPVDPTVAPEAQNNAP